jgi:hypothetical protein
MKKNRIILLLLIGITVHAQDKYFLPVKYDSVSIINSKFDFSNYGYSIGLTKKIDFLDKLIFANDTDYVFQLLGFQTYQDFKAQQYDFEKYPFTNRHEDVEKYLTLIDLNGDTLKDVIFDDLNPWMEFHRIHMIIKGANDWKELDISGFIITNANFGDHKLLDFDTYEWACCDYPYNIYRRYISSSDTFKLNETIGIPRGINLSLINSSLKEVTVGNDSLVVYMDYEYRNDFEHDIKLANCTVTEHARIRFHEIDYSLIEIEFKYKVGFAEFDKIFGWIKSVE